MAINFAATPPEVSVPFRGFTVFGEVVAYNQFDFQGLVSVPFRGFTVFGDLLALTGTGGGIYPPLSPHIPAKRRLSHPFVNTQKLQP